MAGLYSPCMQGRASQRGSWGVPAAPCGARGVGGAAFAATPGGSGGGWCGVAIPGQWLPVSPDHRGVDDWLQNNNR